MEESYKVANTIDDEISAKNAEFKKLYDHMRVFWNNQYLWFQVAEYSYDTFMIRARQRG